MKTSNYLILALLSLIVFSCKKQQEDTIQQTTQQISKIETFYNGLSPKMKVNTLIICLFHRFLKKNLNYTWQE